MRWADKDLEGLASIYWEEIAPKFRVDGHNPESEYPSYDWLVSNGYRGFRYPFRGAHDSYDLSLAKFFRQEIEQIRQTPTKLCRLTWTDDPDTWSFAFYKYSDGRYEPSICLDGSFAGSPESCFDTAAQLYLQ